MPDSIGRMVVCIDFDGVINQYKGFKGPGVFEQPMPGAAEYIQQLKDDGWVIIIYTSRGEAVDVAHYLREHGIPFDAINRHHETYDNPMNPGKPHADVYIDDKAVRFEGNWADTYRQLKYTDVRPWWEKE